MLIIFTNIVIDEFEEFGHYSCTVNGDMLAN